MDNVVYPVNKTFDDLVQSNQHASRLFCGLEHWIGVMNMSGVNGSISVPALRLEISRMREQITRIKSLVNDGSKVSVQVSENLGSSFAQLKKKQMVDDPTRTLLERIGGDLSLETCIEVVYNKAIHDSRVRAFFEKNVRKMISIRKKMHDLMTGVLGGRKLYNIEDLKPTHYHMNITDYHVDAMVELFQQTFEEMGVHPDAAAETIASIRKLRKDLTTGCTVRMEIARKAVQAGGGTLFNTIGGHEGIATFLDRVYDIIAVDSRLKKYFAGRNLAVIKNGQKVYITELVGGPKIYQGSSLIEIHKNLSVDDYLFDCFLMDCEKALSGLGYEDHIIDQVLVVLEPCRAPIIGKSRGVVAGEGSDKGKIVNGKTIVQRLNGEMNLEAIVETAFNGFSIDPRIKYFFSDKGGSKREDFKRKVCAAIGSTIGGTAVYDVSRIKQLHYNFNITNYAFDALMENFITACELMEIEKPVIQDFAEALQKFRSDVTAGCTVRLEIAMKKTETVGTDNLFAVLDANSDGLVKILSAAYKYVLLDNRIAHFFKGSKVDALMKAQGKYLGQLFGSPEQYQGRDLEYVHSMISVSDFHFDTFLENIRKAMLDIGIDESVIDQCTVMMESCRLSVVNRSFRKHNTRKAQELATRKTLFDRIGGEIACTKLADLVYDKAVGDDRLRLFIDKNKAKVQSMKKKISQFCIILSGGTSSYDVADIRPAHYSMNITDYHFDAMCEVFENVLKKELNIKKFDSREFLRRLQPFRAEITTGCTVRTEIARNNLLKGKDQLFNKMGKADGIRKFIDQLFEVISNDPRIRTFFEKSNKDKLRAGQTIFVTELLGGPKVYKGQNLNGVHKAMGISDYHFDAFLNDVSRALLGAGRAEVDIDEVLITMESLRGEVLGRDTDAAALRGVMRDGVLLHERLGGELAVESLIETAYDKSMEDPRLKFYFDKPKAKIRQIKQRMYQFVLGACGGPAHYDASNLKSTHSSMNITDHHFDAFLDNISITANEMNIDKDTLEDILTVLNRVRVDVTTGCTVRMELSRKRTQADGLSKLFEKMGGADGIEAIMMRLYECIDRDKRISGYFEGAKSIAVRGAVSEYLTMTFGGPAKRSGRSLEEIHSIVNVDDHHFDCFVQCFQRAVRDSGCSMDIVDEAIACIESLRKKVLVVAYSGKQS